MSQASELIAKQMAAGASIGKIWGTLIFNVKDTAYGAKGDGISDDTAAIQAAINACSAAGGGIVYFPVGNYIITDTSAITTNGVTIQGAGRLATTLQFNSLTKDAFLVTGSMATIKDMTIRRVGAGTPTAGAGIKLQGNPYHFLLENTLIVEFFDSVDVESGVLYTLRNSYFVDHYNFGVYLRNIVNGDSGDGVVEGNTFDTSKGAMSGVRIESGGGLKFYGNKINRHNFGFDLQVEDAANTSILILNGNSIENQLYEFIRIGRKGTTGNYSLINITGNVHNGSLPNGHIGYDISAAGCPDINITGNTLNGIAGAVAITIRDGTNVMIGDNVFTVWDYVFDIKAGVQKVKIGHNVYDAIGVNVISDAGTNNTIAHETQKGSVSGTTPAAANYGSMFSTPAIAVTFPVPFKALPKVAANINGGGGGGVSAIVQNITLTGCQIILLGVVPSATLSGDWIAEGIL